MSFADYRELYRQKLTTADEAVKVVKSGDWVDYGFCAIQPRVLDEALARRAPELEDEGPRRNQSVEACYLRYRGPRKPHYFQFPPHERGGAPLHRQRRRVL